MSLISGLRHILLHLTRTYGATLAGALIMLAGIPTASVYQHRIKKMSKEYNALGQKQEPVVSFRPASSGLGVAMVF